MRFITLLENFKKGVNLAERICGKNFTLPILSNLLLKVVKNKIYIIATDLETGIEIVLGGKNEGSNEEEKLVVPAKIFANFLNNLNEERITLETKDQRLIIQSGKYEAEFSLLNPDEFPIIPKIKTTQFFEINKLSLKEAFSKVVPAINVNASRPEITGVYFLLEDNLLKIVGTDSFRLAEKTITLENKYSGKAEFILPVKASNEVIKIIQEGIEEEFDHQNIQVYPESNQVQFKLGETRLISQVINGEYPNYQSIIPKDFLNSVIVDKKEILEAIKVVGLFSGKINDILLELNPNKKEIILTAQDQTFGKSRTSLKVKEIKGNHLTISFDYRFLIDGITNCEGDFVFLGFNKENNPALIKGEEEKDYFYVVMPIKL